jgi:hypothetical protein
MDRFSKLNINGRSRYQTERCKLPGQLREYCMPAVALAMDFEAK